VSALRFDTPVDGVLTALTLRISSDRSTSPPALALCPPDRTWAPPSPSPGSWEERPKADCERAQLDGRFSDDGKTVVFGLNGFRASQFVDLVLTQQPAAAQGVIDISFEKPLMSDVALTSLTGAGVPSGASNHAVAEQPASSEPARASEGLSAPPPLAEFASAERSSPAIALPDAAVASDGRGATPAVAADSPRAPDDAQGQEPAWDTRRKVALAVLIALCVCITSVVSRRDVGGGAGRRSATIYRGSTT
jgi:hypothetical protein